jgi:epoxyqueuosine reductase
MQEDKFQLIQAKAESLGFNFSGVTTASQTPHFKKFLSWLDKKQYGQLNFLQKDYVVDSRRDPSILLKDAQSVIILGVNYGPRKINQQGNRKNETRIAAYAHYTDYHKIIRSKASELMRQINFQKSGKINYRIFIDSGPVMEKDFAYAAGLGWIGKNSLLIHPKFGSFSFLCCIFTDEFFDCNLPLSEDLCASCQACIRACPTMSISEDHSINATRCISYLTIEHTGIIPREMRSKIGNWIFGCDICQNVCPHNKNINLSPSNLFFGYKKECDQTVDLLSELMISERDFFHKFKGNPMVRLGYEQYVRNLIIATGNSQNERYIEALLYIFQVGSEILRVHAVWALGEITQADSLKFFQLKLDGENSQIVKREMMWLKEKWA